MIEIANVFMPTVEIPCDLCEALDKYDVGNKINGMMTYEVISKDESGVKIKITGLLLNPGKRIN